MFQVSSTRFEEPETWTLEQGTWNAVLLNLNGDRLPLCLLCLRESNAQYPVFKGGLHLISGNRRREFDRPGKGAIGPLNQVVVLVLLLFRLPFLPLQGQHIPGDADVQIFDIQTGKLGLDNQRFFSFGDIQMRSPSHPGQVQSRHLTQEPIKQPVHLSSERTQVSEWCPLYERHRRSSFPWNRAFSDQPFRKDARGPPFRSGCCAFRNPLDQGLVTLAAVQLALN